MGVCVYAWGNEYPSSPNVQASSVGPDTWVWFPVPAVWSVSSLRAFYLQPSRSQVLWGVARLSVVCMRLSEEWGWSRTPINPHCPSYSPKPGAHTLISPSVPVWPLGGLGGQRLHPFLPLQLFPPTHRAHTSSQGLPGGASPSPLRRAPWPRSLGPTHFLYCLNSAPTQGGKFLSLRWAAPSPFFPGWPGRLKASG